MNTTNQDSYEYVISRMAYDNEFKNKDSLPTFERYCGLINLCRDDLTRVVESYLLRLFSIAQNNLSFDLPYQYLYRLRQDIDYGLIADWIIEEHEEAEAKSAIRMKEYEQAKREAIARHEAELREELEAEKAEEVRNGD